MITIEKVKETAEKLFEKAKNEISEHGSVMPLVAGIVGDSVFFFGLTEYDDRKPYYIIARNLSLLHADYAILVNDAYFKKLEADDDALLQKELENYKHGDYAEDPDAVECIMIAIKCASGERYQKMTPYQRNGVGDIVFDETSEWMSEVNINILPDWWDDDRLKDVEMIIGMMKAIGKTVDEIMTSTMRVLGATDQESIYPKEVIEHWIKSVPPLTKENLDARATSN